jgi:hypothetical protein
VTTLAEQRRFFAEKIETLCDLHSKALVEAFATTSRERSFRPVRGLSVAKRTTSQARRAKHPTPIRAACITTSRLPPSSVAHKRDDDFEARLVTVVTIYSAVGLRDSTMNERLGNALMRGQYPRFTRLRRDQHDDAGLLAARNGLLSGCLALPLALRHETR